jgi:hybrid cluster-associated redox disulfide protein
MSKITKDMSIIKVVQENPKAAEIFAKYGMGCVGCVAARFENIEQGAKAHGFDDKKIDEMIKEMNELEK